MLLFPLIKKHEKNTRFLLVPTRRKGGGEKERGREVGRGRGRETGIEGEREKERERSLERNRSPALRSPNTLYFRPPS